MTEAWDRCPNCRKQFSSQHNIPLIIPDCLHHICNNCAIARSGRVTQCNVCCANIVLEPEHLVPDSHLLGRVAARSLRRAASPSSSPPPLRPPSPVEVDTGPSCPQHPQLPLFCLASAEPGLGLHCPLCVPDNNWASVPSLFTKLQTSGHLDSLLSRARVALNRLDTTKQQILTWQASRSREQLAKCTKFFGEFHASLDLHEYNIRKEFSSSEEECCTLIAEDLRRIDLKKRTIESLLEAATAEKLVDIPDQAIVVKVVHELDGLVNQFSGLKSDIKDLRIPSIQLDPSKIKTSIRSSSRLDFEAFSTVCEAAETKKKKKKSKRAMVEDRLSDMVTEIIKEDRQPAIPVYLSGKEKVRLAHYTSPDSFFVIRSANIATRDDLEESLADQWKDSKQALGLKDEVVMAYCNGKLSRVQIKDPTEKENVIVKFLDEGKSEGLPLQFLAVLPKIASITKVPPLAHECSLSELMWTYKEMIITKKFLQNAEICCQVVGRKAGTMKSAMYVQVTKEGEEGIEYLMDLISTESDSCTGLPQLELEVNKEFLAVISEIDNKGQISLTVAGEHGDNWLASQLQELTAMMEEILSREDAKKINDDIPNDSGQYCIVRNVHGKPCRAKIIQREDESKLRVELVDYAAEEIVEKDGVVGMFDKALMRVPVLGIKVLEEEITKRGNCKAMLEMLKATVLGIRVTVVIKKMNFSPWLVSFLFSLKRNLLKTKPIHSRVEDENGNVVKSRRPKRKARSCEKLTHSDIKLKDIPEVQSMKEDTKLEGILAPSEPELDIPDAAGLDLNTVYKCQVLNFVSPEEIYLRLLSDHQKYHELAWQLEHAPLQALREEAIVPGALCLVRIDGWARASISTVYPEQVQVRLLDYGVSQIINRQELKHLPNKFRKLPEMGFQSRLVGMIPAGGGSTWTQTAIAKFKELLDKENGEVIIEVDEKSVKHLEIKQTEENLGAMPVKMFTETIVSSSPFEPATLLRESLSDALVNEGLVMLEDVLEVFEERSSDWREHNWLPPTIPSSQYIEAMVNYVDKESVIHISTAPGLQKIELIEQQLNQNQRPITDLVADSSNDPSWCPGQSCIAQYEGDSKWCRAVVLTVDMAVVTVKFVDYGSEQECRVSQVRPLQGRGEGLEIPAQSIPVILNIKPTQGVWEGEALDFLFNFLSKEEFVKFRVIDRSSFPLQVEVFTKEGSAVDAMTREGFAQSTSQPLIYDVDE